MRRFNSSEARTLALVQNGKRHKFWGWQNLVWGRCTKVRLSLHAQRSHFSSHVWRLFALMAAKIVGM